MGGRGDLTADLLSEVCHDVSMEPPLSGEILSRATAPGWMLRPKQCAYFDVLIFNPNAPSYRVTQMSACYWRHKREKRRAYEQRVLEIEQGSFTPLVFSTSGGMGSGATIAYKRLASLLYIHQERATLQYSDELALLPHIYFTSPLCCHGSQRLMLKTWLCAT